MILGEEGREEVEDVGWVYHWGQEGETSRRSILWVEMY